MNELNWIAIVAKDEAPAATGAGDGKSGAPGGGGLFGGDMTTTLLMFGGLFFILYFFMIRPQKKQQQEAEQMRNTIERGDTILTVGGIKGIVHSMEGDTVVIRTADDSKIELIKGAISKVLQKKNAVAPASDAKK